HVGLEVDLDLRRRGGSLARVERVGVIGVGDARYEHEREGEPLHAAVVARQASNFTTASATPFVDAGFWPVTSRLPTTTCAPNGSAAFVYLPPAARSASSSRNGTTAVSFTASS